MLAQSKIDKYSRMYQTYFLSIVLHLIIASADKPLSVCWNSVMLACLLVRTIKNFSHFAPMLTNNSQHPVHLPGAMRSSDDIAPKASNRQNRDDNALPTDFYTYGKVVQNQTGKKLDFTISKEHRFQDFLVLVWWLLLLFGNC